MCNTQCQPLDDALLEPIPSKLIADRPSVSVNSNEHSEDNEDGKGKLLTAKDHLNQRLAATYHIKKQEDVASD